MAWTQPTVIVWVPTWYEDPNSWFNLNDNTRGIGSAYKLAAPEPIDVTCWVHSVSIRRGRSRPIGKIDAGICSVRLRNFDREFDPHPLKVSLGSIRPGLRVQVLVGSDVIFEGRINAPGWAYDWPAEPMESTVTFTASDALTTLAQRQIQSAVFPSQPAGKRIEAALKAVGVKWPLSQMDIDPGVNILARDTVEARNALAYCQLAADSDLGRFYAARTGELTFRDRRHTGGSTTFAFTPTGPQFRAASARADVIDQFTEVVVTTPDHDPQIWRNEYAEHDEGYLLSTRRYDTLLRERRDAKRLANRLGVMYGEPDLPFSFDFSPDHDSFDPTDQADIAQLELGDRVDVTWTPTGHGSQWVQQFIVEQIEHLFPGPEEPWKVQLWMTSRLYQEQFVLGSGTAGLLDTSRLGF